MGTMPLNAPMPWPAAPVEEAWGEQVQAQVAGTLRELLELPDEVRLDVQWAQALECVRAYVARPGWRGHAALLLAGHGVARGSSTVPARLWRFAAGLELLHVCRALHDEVVEQDSLVRSAPLLQPLLAPSPTGAHLAVVVGDHLFARAFETMLSSSLPGAPEATRYCLRMDRASVAGEVRMMKAGVLGERGGVRQALRLARLRGLRRGLAPALVCGAMLGGADEGLRLRLARVGCGLGLALELGEQLAGLFDSPRDFTRGRCTFPVMAAWSRARPAEREALEALWALPEEARDGAALLRARGLVEMSGGRVATERLIARSARGAVRALATLPHAQGLRELLRTLLGQLAHPHRGDVP